MFCVEISSIMTVGRAKQRLSMLPVECHFITNSECELLSDRGEEDVYLRGDACVIVKREESKISVLVKSQGKRYYSYLDLHTRVGGGDDRMSLYFPARLHPELAERPNSSLLEIAWGHTALFLEVADLTGMIAARM